MQNKFRRIFTDVEQIIITSLLENRYSHQVVRSINVLSNETGIPLANLDCSVNSLSLIDNYLNSLTDKKTLGLEVYLSITIYLSQVSILACNGIWTVKSNVFSSSEEVLRTGERFWIYSLHIVIYDSSFITYPQYDAMNNILRNKSHLKREATKLVSAIKIDKSKIREAHYYNRYQLAGLDRLIEEKDFDSEIPLLISSFSKAFNIPEKKLNKSVNSLTLINESIRTQGKNKNILYDTDPFDRHLFLALLVYIGEVIIKAVNGKWKVNPERIHITGSGPQYHWNLRILNSEGRVLKDFLNNICAHLSIHGYMNCRINKQVELYISADKKRDEYTWYDFQEYNNKQKIWKMELIDDTLGSFTLGLNDEVGSLSDLIIPTLG
jgi:hypothetical protein